MPGDPTTTEKIVREIDSFATLWRKRRRLTILVASLFVGGGLYLAYGWWSRGESIDELTAQNSELKRDLRQIEAENKGLRETVAPLLARAAKEFPGEEINISLKKIVEKL